MRLGALAIASILSTTAAVAAAPLHVYLTWQGDTSRTMTVTFHTEEPLTGAQVRFDTQSRGGQSAAYASRAEAESRLVSGLRKPRYIHTVELTKLDPGTAYYFIAGAEGNFGREMKFRTIPEGDAPIRFVTGGDMDVVREVRDLLAQASKHDPMFGLIGGDLAYANGDLRNFAKWDRWIKNWSETFITPEGFMVPMVLAIGNHEVNDLEGDQALRGPFYFGYFPQGGKSFL